MCKEAVASDGRAFALGLNTSIVFMLAMVFVIPLGFGFVVWRSVRSASERRARGEDVATPGALRWNDSAFEANPRKRKDSKTPDA
jgi:hypothetical protein